MQYTGAKTGTLERSRLGAAIQKQPSGVAHKARLEGRRTCTFARHLLVGVAHCTQGSRQRIPRLLDVPRDRTFQFPGDVPPPGTTRTFRGGEMEACERCALGSDKPVPSDFPPPAVTRISRCDGIGVEAQFLEVLHEDPKVLCPLRDSQHAHAEESQNTTSPEGLHGGSAGRLTGGPAQVGGKKRVCEHGIAAWDEEHKKGGEAREKREEGAGTRCVSRVPTPSKSKSSAGTNSFVLPYAPRCSLLAQHPGEDHANERETVRCQGQMEGRRKDGKRGEWRRSALDSAPRFSPPSSIAPSSLMRAEADCICCSAWQARPSPLSSTAALFCTRAGAGDLSTNVTLATVIASLIIRDFKRMPDTCDTVLMLPEALWAVVLRSRSTQLMVGRILSSPPCSTTVALATKFAGVEDWSVSKPPSSTISPSTTKVGAGDFSGERRGEGVLEGCVFPTAPAPLIRSQSLQASKCLALTNDNVQAEGSLREASGAIACVGSLATMPVGGASTWISMSAERGAERDGVPGRLHLLMCTRENGLLLHNRCSSSIAITSLSRRKIHADMICERDALSSQAIVPDRILLCGEMDERIQRSDDIRNRFGEIGMQDESMAALEDVDRPPLLGGTPRQGKALELVSFLELLDKELGHECDAKEYPK
ncbi:hypothetical protein B0H17DRAFT_1134589 [Mycena rosella]|uniref:Uncharacterized protein n=1 Tax=Mycena rosella TaxID=1033263 RepID=A0AAD7GI40_MYCRO|nr:hypothetical protein B0H17DRAFT_1134589 [Mycena rosella]